MITNRTLPRRTIQRKAIEEFLRKSKEHPTAEELHIQLQKHYPSLSLATVYRNLNEMAAEGLIHRLRSGERYRFDGNEMPHLHLITANGKILDIPDERLSERALTLMQKKGFDCDRVEITFYTKKVIP